MLLLNYSWPFACMEMFTTGQLSLSILKHQELDKVVIVRPLLSRLNVIPD